MKAKRRNKQVRVQDIADVLKISASSVSRALNDHPRISSSTKEKVKEVATRLGYFQDTPKLMNPAKVEAVAVLVPTLENRLYREIVSGVTDYLNQNNYQALLLDYQGDDQLVKSFFKSHHKYGISGILHLISNRNIPAKFYSLPELKDIPLITVFEPDVSVNQSSVIPDLYQAVSNIVEHINSQGIDKTALILENDNKPEDIQIATAFESAIEISGSDEKDLSIYYLADEEQHLESLVDSILSEKPQAILVKDVYSAIAVKHQVEGLGLNISNDVLLIAIDAELPASVLTANMSLLKLPAYEMGHEAAEILLNKIKDPELEKETLILPASFILKGSAIRKK